MPRYFFDVEDGHRTIDEEGMELADRQAVPTAAMTALLDIGRFEVVTKDERRLRIVVRNEGGRPIYRSELLIQADWLAEGD